MKHASFQIYVMFAMYKKVWYVSLRQQAVTIKGIGSEKRTLE